MPKWVMNYESGNYEWIEKDGFSIDQGCYVYNWDNSEYIREEQENLFRQNWKNILNSDEDDDW